MCSFFNTKSTIDYTILSTNYTGGAAQQSVPGLLFRNYCINDYGSELGSFHSDIDYDSYFDLIIEFQNHPFGLKYQECVIGLTNRSAQGSWQWFDNTPYDWGIAGTSSSYWSTESDKNLHCVRVDNSLSRRLWTPFRCDSTFEVHCGVCNTPKKRPYLLELEGTFNSSSDDTAIDSSVLLWVQLNGTDLFGNGINSIGFFSINITQFNWTYTQTWINYTNIGPIETITFLIRNYNANVTINYIRLNYIEDSVAPIGTSDLIEINTQINNATGKGCNYQTITIQYPYDNYTVDNQGIYGDACNYLTNSGTVPTEEPTGRPTSSPTKNPVPNPSGQPSPIPTGQPTELPSISPTKDPTNPTFNPSPSPTDPTYFPSTIPTTLPSKTPSVPPTNKPSNRPSSSPSRTGIPTDLPTNHPTILRDRYSTTGGEIGLTSTERITTTWSETTINTITESTTSSLGTIVTTATTKEDTSNTTPTNGIETTNGEATTTSTNTTVIANLAIPTMTPSISPSSAPTTANIIFITQEGNSNSNNQFDGVMLSSDAVIVIGL